MKWTGWKATPRSSAAGINPAKHLRAPTRTRRASHFGGFYSLGFEQGAEAVA